jgi:hypothetical protein
MGGGRLRELCDGPGAFHRPFVGTAGWSIPSAHAASFPIEGSHLERYALRLNAVEINSSFYRAVADGWRSHQCRRRRAHGPKGLFCYAHDPAVVRVKQAARLAARRMRAAELESADRARLHRENFGNAAISAVRDIAAGHDRPHELARLVIALFGKESIDPAERGGHDVDVPK